MDKVFAVIKRHPYLFAGAVGVLVLYFIISGRSSNNVPASTPYNVQQDPNVIAAQAGLAGTQIQANAATTEASLQAGVLGQAINAQQSLQKSQTDALLGIAQAQFGAATNIAQIQATGAVNLTNATGAAQLALQENQNSSNFALAQLELPVLETQAIAPVLIAEMAALTSLAGGFGPGGGDGGAGGNANVSGFMWSAGFPASLWTALYPQQSAALFQNILSQVSAIGGVRGQGGGPVPLPDVPFYSGIQRLEGINLFNLPSSSPAPTHPSGNPGGFGGFA